MSNNVYASISSPEKCRCCLVEGRHGYRYDPEMFTKTLNITVANKAELPAAMCGACWKFVQDVSSFRDMVLVSYQHLMLVGNPGTTEVILPNETEFEDGKVKVEYEDKDLLSIIEKDIGLNTDCKQNAEMKMETHSNYDSFSDRDIIDNKDYADIKVEFDEPIAKVKRKRKIKDSHRNTKPRKKRTSNDSESDTPIAFIKERTSRLKDEAWGETNPPNCTSESRKHSFVDNSKIRSNILLILKHSTVLPFRNNFKSTFKCFYCDKLYIPFKELKQHIEKEHGDVSEATLSKIIRALQSLIITADISCIKCKICEEEFKSIESLVEHLRNSHKKIYHDTDKKPSHGIMGVDLSTDNIKCHICNKEFAFFKNLSIHMNEHYGHFVCYVCGKKFLSETRYKSHVFKAHSVKTTKCKHCGEVFKTEPALSYHIRKEHVKKSIKCLKCPLTFPSGQYIKRLNHMAEMHGIEKPKFRCDTCDRDYSNSGSLAAHKRYTHIRLKELRCEICGYITVHKGVMKNHMDFHNGVKNYECEFCKKKFGKPYTLKLHLRIHLNDKRFACKLCDAAFIQKNSLKSHLKSRHPDSGIDIRTL